MKIKEKLKNGKVQYELHREAAKVSALLLVKIITEILLPDQRTLKEQTKFFYSPLE